MGAVMAARKERLAALVADPDAFWDEFTQRMCDNDNPEQPHEICRAKDVAYGKLLAWIEEDDARTERWMRLLELQAAVLVSQTIAIADEQKEVVRKDGSTFDPDVARDTLRINTRFKVAKHHAPKTYGDKQDVNVNVQQWVLRLPEQAESTEQWRASVARVINSKHAAVPQIAQTPALTSGVSVPETVSADVAPV